MTSTNTKPEVVFSGRGRHIEKWILRHISAMGAPIWTKFGRLMQSNMQITANWPRSKSEVELRSNGRNRNRKSNSNMADVCFSKTEGVISQPSIEICRAVVGIEF